MTINPTMIRQLWTLVESTQASILLKLDDASLVHWLLKQLQNQQSFDNQQTHLLNNYIRAKIPLIRDLAQQR